VILPDILRTAAVRTPDHPALSGQGRELSYAGLAQAQDRIAAALLRLGVRRNDRVAIYLDKRPETVLAIFGAFAAGAVAVPCNPVLKPAQVAHILRDSGARMLVTSAGRLDALGAEALAGGDGGALSWAVTADAEPPPPRPGLATLAWQELVELGADAGLRGAGPAVDTDMAAILYTSGSTGKPKGVVLSHRNLAVGGESVAGYLGNGPHDRILAVLPLSFDAGLSQLTTAFTAGATAVLHNFLVPQDVARVCAREGITGMTCVPPLWIKLAQAGWDDGARAKLRYFANTGGRMPRDVLDRLRRLFPNAAPYLMYGLTEAFRSTYLDPAEVDRRPDSIGKAIPNAEILVAKADGTLAGPGEEGELVHRGPLVSLGYWNDPERTAARFRPAPGQPTGLPMAEPAVWSGDVVRLDQDGYLYFVSRMDEMIKTSGYRVSPSEIEEAAYDSGSVVEAAAFGVPHPELGQAIVLALVPTGGVADAAAIVRAHCRRALPAFMQPAHLEVVASLPQSPNGKIDRRALAADHAARFEETEA
jgi:acyl-CoA ligase (AMP-forming) (exosortase A-associated)